MIIVESWNNNKKKQPAEEGIYLVYGRDYDGIVGFSTAKWTNDTIERWAGWEDCALEYIDYWTPFIAPEGK